MGCVVKSGTATSMYQTSNSGHTALHIYKLLIIKELYVALQNIRGLIAL